MAFEGCYLQVLQALSGNASVNSTRQRLGPPSPEIACNQPGLGQDYRWLRDRKLLVPWQQMMKITGDYKAKTRLWAEHLKVVAPPPGPRLPRFGSKRFRTHAEMNRWKAELLREIAGEASTHG